MVAKLYAFLLCALVSAQSLANDSETPIPLPPPPPQAYTCELGFKVDRDSPWVPTRRIALDYCNHWESIFGETQECFVVNRSYQGHRQWRAEFFLNGSFHYIGTSWHDARLGVFRQSQIWMEDRELFLYPNLSIEFYFLNPCGELPSESLPPY